MQPKKSRWRLSCVAMIIAMILAMPQIATAAFAEQTTFFDGTLIFSVESDNNDSSATTFSVVTTDSAVKGCARNPRAWSANTATVTIRMTNNCGKKATLAFTYNFSAQGEGTVSVTSTGSLTDSSGSTTDNTGDCSVMLENGGYVDIKFTATGSWVCNDNYMNITSITLTPAADSANVTVNYDSTCGTVTANGETVASGDSAATVDGSVTLTAQPTSGATFVGWFDSEQNFISSENPYTIAPSGDITLTAVMTTEAMFIVDGVYYSDLHSAITAAGNSKTIILANTGTLPAGNYTIPSGVTLLIPFDDANTVKTTAPATIDTGDDHGALVIPTPYRTLTMASGANISVNGAISIGGTVHCNMAKGTPYGPVGFISMKDNSTITINSGAYLYAWGYITGSGAVTVKSGGTVYESFQISDWRGGSATSAMVENEEKIFPITQYHVQNVEVPMTLEAGAVEYGFMSVLVTLAGHQSTKIAFIGSDDGMFRIAGGSITKDYDEANDRLIIDLNDAELNVEKCEISIKVALLSGAITIDSSDYVLPVTSNLTLNVNSGSTVNLNQDMAFLPGSEVNIESGATCYVTNDSSVYVYDRDEWGNYCGAGNKFFTTVAYAPGKQRNRTQADIVDAAVKVNGTVDASAGYIYTTSSGANIYSTDAGKVIQRVGSTTVTYQATYVEDGYTPNEISVVPAWLKNIDGSFTETANGAGTYNYIDGYWHYNTETHVDENGDNKCDCAGCPAVVVAQTKVKVVVDGVETETDKKFFSLKEAVENTSDGFITMLAPTTESTYTINKAVTIDLNKFKVEVGGASATVTCIDSGTNAFASVPGTNLGSINVEAVAPTEAVNGKYYIAITGDDGVTTFHRVAVGVTCCQFIYDKPNNKQYIVVQGTFKGTDQSVAKLTDLGFKFTDTGATTAGTSNLDVTFDTSYDGATWSYYFGRDFDSSVTGTVTVQALMEFGQGATPFMSNPTEDLVALYKAFLNGI